MTQKRIQGDQLDLTDADGSVLTGVDADLLNGQNGAFYRDASNMNAGTLPVARLSGTYAISISGNAATATTASSATTATTANNALNLGGTPAASYALLASPLFTGNPRAPTPTFGDNDTSLATTAFVQSAVAAVGGGTVFNSTSYVPSARYGSLSPALAHGLGGTPDMAQLILTNVVSQFGFNPGEQVILNPSIHDFDEGGGPSRTSNLIVFNSTHVWFALASGGIGISGKTAGVGLWNTITAANWLVHVRVVKF